MDSELVYGKSGSGKTTWWMTMAEDIFKRTGKTTRLYIGDGGFATVDGAGLVEDGIVEAFHFNNVAWPLTTVRHMGRGYWPNDKGVLVPPEPEALAKVGLFVFEGLTVMSDYVMGSITGGLADRASKGEKIGQDSPVMVKDPSGETYGGNAMAHFMVGQGRIREVVQLTSTLPGRVIWTAHEKAAEDKDDGNEKIIGPAAVGKALTATIPGWFGNTIHLTGATKKVRAKDAATGKDVDRYEIEKRAYTRDHSDPDGLVFVRCMANARVPLVNGKQTMPEFLAPPDPLKFYQIIEDAKEAVRASRKIAA
jgi:hypothetical protein